jgi:hypothetical protein
VTLTPGTTYSFKVTARNSVGSSAESAVLSVLAAKIPDAPLSLANDAAVTTAYQVGLTWSAGSYNGGSSVIDYQVSYAESPSGSYAVFASDVLTTSSTVTSLTPGTTYKFKVQSRNVVGLSADSSEITVLAAQIPDAPTTLANNAAVTSAN